MGVFQLQFALAGAMLSQIWLLSLNTFRKQIQTEVEVLFVVQQINLEQDHHGSLDDVASFMTILQIHDYTSLQTFWLVNFLIVFCG